MIYGGIHRILMTPQEQASSFLLFHSSRFKDSGVDSFIETEGYLGYCEVSGDSDEEFGGYYEPTGAYCEVSGGQM